ncbi:hypothetical protein [Halomontanus rarus]|uniref:hypothetical protein n=1 Tax=Halomontanus rarus TaxID=3034020 RepID=UPI0023E7F2D4|nr:hypothetical protein [Halovivax sp. TS33]
MTYGRLVDRFTSDDTQVRVTTFPDGSVDTYYTVFDEHGERITDRETFGKLIASGDLTSISIERESREPGGQAPNMAIQTHALGEETTVVGHLDDPVFDELPFETLSMGEPSRIDVYPFDDDDLVFARTSADIDSWSLADLRTVSLSTRDPLSADVVCCGNWASLEGLTAALSELAVETVDGGTFVLDPGPVKNRSRGAVSELLETLGELESAFDVVYSVNPEELEYTAEAADIEAKTDRERLAEVRTVADISGAVLHASDRAVVAPAEAEIETEIETEVETETKTKSGDEIVVPNLDAEEPRRRTGAGDRFSAAVAIARAREWDWTGALALGNLCATYYVETAETGDPEVLSSYLDRRSEN